MKDPNPGIRPSHESRGEVFDHHYLTSLLRSALQPSPFHSPRGDTERPAAAFQLGAEQRMPMAVSAVTASHLTPSFPARSRRRRAAPRAAAGGVTARARRLRCEFVAGGGNGALSGEDDPRFMDRVRISPLTSLLLPSSACPPFLLVFCWCHFVEQVRRSPREPLCIVFAPTHEVQNSKCGTAMWNSKGTVFATMEYC